MPSSVTALSGTASKISLHKPESAPHQYFALRARGKGFTGQLEPGGDSVILRGVIREPASAVLVLRVHLTPARQLPATRPADRRSPAGPRCPSSTWPSQSCRVVPVSEVCGLWPIFGDH